MCTVNWQTRPPTTCMSAKPTAKTMCWLFYIYFEDVILHDGLPQGLATWPCCSFSFLFVTVVLFAGQADRVDQVHRLTWQFIYDSYYYGPLLAGGGSDNPLPHHNLKREYPRSVFNLIKYDALCNLLHHWQFCNSLMDWWFQDRLHYVEGGGG